MSRYTILYYPPIFGSTMVYQVHRVKSGANRMFKGALQADYEAILVWEIFIVQIKQVLSVK